MRSNQLLSIITAIIVWLLGVSFYLASFQLSILKNVEVQANIILALGIIPSVYLGTYLFYKKASPKPSYLALTYIGIAATLDALITVPLFVIPAGGSHLEFFSNPVFYLIVVEIYVLVFYFGNHLTKTIRA